MTPKRPTGDVSSPDKSRFLLYTTEDGGQRIEVRLETGSVWLSQKLMGDLFQVGVNTINHHVKGIYADGELSPGATIRRYRIVQIEGNRHINRMVDFYRKGTGHLWIHNALISLNLGYDS